MFKRYLKVPTKEDPLDNGSSSAGNQSGLASSSHSVAGMAETHAQQQQRDLQATFDEDIEHNPTTDDDDIPLHAPETERLLESHPQPVSTSSSSAMPSTHDGVFANMSAKPGLDRSKDDEPLPAYEAAAMDATPPYWQTSVVAPLMPGDVILVEGLPVGHIFVFAWNLLVSASFQLVGFLFTYMLHTSHAGKCGSLAGLGISLVQYGFYIHSRGSLNDIDYGDGNDSNPANEAHANIIAYFLMILGWYIVIRSVVDYLQARKMERIINTNPSPEEMV